MNTVAKLAIDVATISFAVVDDDDSINTHSCYKTQQLNATWRVTAVSMHSACRPGHARSLG